MSFSLKMDILPWMEWISCYWNYRLDRLNTKQKCCRRDSNKWILTFDDLSYPFQSQADDWITHIHLMNTKILVCALGSLRHRETGRNEWTQVFVLSLTQKTRHLCQAGSPSYANFLKLKRWVLELSSRPHVFHKLQRGRDSAPHHPQGCRWTGAHLCGVSRVTATAGEEESHTLTLQLLLNVTVLVSSIDLIG